MFHANGGFFTTTPWWLFWVILVFGGAMLVQLAIEILPYLVQRLGSWLAPDSRRRGLKK